MYGDFSRLLFHPDRAEKHYSAVLLQQGRVQLDSDANEQAAILLHYLRTLATDLIGPYGGPTGNSGFQIGVMPGQSPLTDLTISKGRYYVDGILAENDTDVSYCTQPDAPASDPLPIAPPFLVYLRVFERLITAVEDPAIREIALGDNGPDTTTRTKVVWQVEVMEIPDDNNTCKALAVGGPTEILDLVRNNYWPAWKTVLQREAGTLAARAKKPSDAMNAPCAIDPDSAYRGVENQLYRVEVHKGGLAGTGPGTATFKWSRDNGSMIFPITTPIADTMQNSVEVTVASLGRDTTLGLKVGDWVEVVDDRYALAPREHDPGPLLQVTSVQPLDLTVKLDAAPTPPVGQEIDLHPFLRRWDQDKRPIVEATYSSTNWLDLEDGIQIQFQANGTYTRGDFWLIPARTATGDIEGGNDPRPPDGVAYHLAPLALIAKDLSAKDLSSIDLRCLFPQSCPP